MGYFSLPDNKSERQLNMQPQVGVTRYIEERTSQYLFAAATASLNGCDGKCAGGGGVATGELACFTFAPPELILGDRL